MVGTELEIHSREGGELIVCQWDSSTRTAASMRRDDGFERHTCGKSEFYIFGIGPLKRGLKCQDVLLIA